MTMHLAFLIAAAFSAGCPPDDITASPVLKEVVGSGKLVFSRTADCADASCREGAYLVPGDKVVVFARRDGRVCALYVGRRETYGWVDADRLRPVPAAERPGTTAWRGDWRDGDDRIRLRPLANGSIAISGEAYWPSANPDPATRPGGPNIGELEGDSRPVGNRLDYADDPDPKATYACHATLRLLGDYLLVDDNGNCGGMNVRFTGIYRRRPRL